MAPCVSTTPGVAPAVLVAGLDLAWGETRSDGVCLATFTPGATPAADRARLVGYAYPRGDDALLAVLRNALPPGAVAFPAVDAPIVCPNPAGARPVDLLSQRLFRAAHAGCHPANARLGPRPPRLLARLTAELGFVAGWERPFPPPGPPADASPAAAPGRVAAEVYPHPALVRWLGLSRIFKYKRGPVAARRAEFARLRLALRGLVPTVCPGLALDGETGRWLGEPWSKPVEDRVDALVCALIALHHLHHRGRRSEVLGDRETGFLLLPAASAAIYGSSGPGSAGVSPAVLGVPPQTPLSSAQI